MARPRKAPAVFRLTVEYTTADDSRRERAVAILAVMYRAMLAERRPGTPKSGTEVSAPESSPSPLP